MLRTLKSGFSMRVRSYKEGDEKKLVSLFDLCFSKRGLSPKRTVRDWIWHFKQYPMFSPRTVLIAERDDEIIGSIIVTLHDFQVRDRTFKVGILEDAMTHPKFAGRGICSDLTSLAIDVAKSLKIDFIEAFPQYHNSTYRIFKYKHDFQEIAKINLLLKPLDYLKTAFLIPKLMTSQYLHGFFGLLTNPESLVQPTGLFSFFHKEHHTMNGSIYNYDEGDESAIIEMMNQYNSSKAGYSGRTLEYWRWRYSLCPDFKRENIFLMKLENRIAGHIAVGFQDYVISQGGASARVAFLYDLCSRNYQSNRKREIESLLLACASSYAKSRDGLFAMTFTCANDIQTVNLFKQVGFYVIGAFPALIKPVSKDFSIDSLQFEQLYVPVESIIK